MGQAPALDASFTASGQSLVSIRNGSMEPSSWHKALAPEPPNAQKLNGASTAHHASQQDHDGAAVVEQSDTQITDAYSPQALYEAFIGAFLLTTSSSFCARSEAVPLNFRTVLLPAKIPPTSASDRWIGSQSQALGTFTCSLLGTGHLILTFSITFCPGLASLEDILSTSVGAVGSNILAAPFGVMTNEEQHSPTHSTAGNAAYTPNNQALSLRSPSDVNTSLWKQACLTVLQLRGVPAAALRSCSWVNLLVAKPKLQDPKTENGRNASSTISIPWPGSLCFRKKIVALSASNRISDTIGSGHDESHDPLGAAYTWLSTSNEREEKMSKRRADRSAYGPKENLPADVRMSRMNAPSPITMRQPGAAGGNAVYPTPPDAIHNLNGVTPSMDGNLSSPGHPLSTVVDVDIDLEPPGGPGSINQHDDEMVEGSDAKPLRSDNNLLSEAENMFDDMGGDMFGDNDITEADFNFFDEDDVDELEMDMTIDSMKVPDIITPSAAVQEEPQDTTTSSVPPVPEVPPVPPAPEPVVFAKPELKHARSSQLEESSQRGRDVQPRSIKRGSSPFDPDSVFKRLRAVTPQQNRHAGSKSAGPSRGSKVFGRVDFDSKMPMLNKKYEHGGLFDFVQPDKDIARSEPGALPKTDYLKRLGSSKTKSQALSRRSSLVKTGIDSDGKLLHQQLLNLDGDLSDGDDSSSSSDNGTNASIKEPVSPVKSTLRQSLLGDDDAASYVASARDHDLVENRMSSLLWSCLAFPFWMAPTHHFLNTFPILSLCPWTYPSAMTIRYRWLSL